MLVTNLFLQDTKTMYIYCPDAWELKTLKNTEANMVENAKNCTFKTLTIICPKIEKPKEIINTGKQGSNYSDLQLFIIFLGTERKLE